MERIEVAVTREDFDSASMLRNNIKAEDCCPIAIALKRMGYANARVVLLRPWGFLNSWYFVFLGQRENGIWPSWPLQFLAAHFDNLNWGRQPPSFPVKGGIRSSHEEPCGYHEFERSGEGR